MAIETAAFLRAKFAEYYRQHGRKAVVAPPSLEQREFAFFWFERTGALRHLGFTRVEELHNFLAEQGPAHAFHSAAYYAVPDAPKMPLKGWQGADLVFDIDADHLGLPCQERHDWWWCTECGYRGRGQRPETCPKCGGARLQEKKWMCEECLGAAKEEAIKVIEDFLIPDFGISRSDITVVFSGHRGYHIHCYAEEVRGLGSTERREIADYITGTGLDLSFHGFTILSGNILKGPDARAPGWERKLAQGLREIFRNPQQIKAIPGLTASQRKILQREAPRILRGLMMEPPRYEAVRGVGVVAWQAIAKYVAKRLRAAVDEPVTTDVHRLIRLPGSLNGKTGFLVKKLEASDLEVFDPFKDAQVFDGHLQILVKESPAFRLGGVEYPAMHEVKREFPMSVAILLLCKGVATLTDAGRQDDV